MLPFSWHQGQDPWSNNAATSRAETQQPTQVHPSPAHRTLSGCIHDENVSSAVTIAVLHKTAIVTADQTFSSLFRSRMSISPSISTIPHDLPEGFAFGAGEIVSGPGAPGRKAGPGLQRPLQGARMQPPKPASARPHPPPCCWHRHRDMRGGPGWSARAALAVGGLGRRWDAPKRPKPPCRNRLVSQGSCSLD
jgi:hypothetical protein